jgi:hypothetical protein
VVCVAFQSVTDVDECVQAGNVKEKGDYTLPKFALWAAAKPMHYGVYAFSPDAL